MSARDTALDTSESTELVTVPDGRLRPTSRGRDIGLMLGGYVGLQFVSVLFGLSGSVGLAVILLTFAWIIRRRRVWFRSVSQQRDIQAALARDDVGEAARLGRSLLMHGPRFGLAHAVSVAVWGVIELRRSRPDQAIAALERALGCGRFVGRTGRVLESWRIIASLAYAYAIIDAVPRAQATLERADAELPQNRKGALLAIRVYVACRGNDPHEAIKLLDTQWRTAEPLLTVGGARTTRMLEAFALELAPDDEYRGDSRERQSRALDRAREAGPGAYDYLAVRWPELADFLARHALSQP